MKSIMEQAYELSKDGNDDEAFELIFKEVDSVTHKLNDICNGHPAVDMPLYLAAVKILNRILENTLTKADIEFARDIDEQIKTVSIRKFKKHE